MFRHRYVIIGLLFRFFGGYILPCTMSSVPEKARSFRESMETQIIISSRGIPRLLPSGRSHGRSFDDLRIALDQGF